MILLKKFITCDIERYNKMYAYNNDRMGFYIQEYNFIHRIVVRSEYCYYYKRNTGIVIECSNYRNKKSFTISTNLDDNDLYINCNTSSHIPYINVKYADHLDRVPVLKFVMNFTEKDGKHKFIHKQIIDNYTYLREYFFKKVKRQMNMQIKE